jgi:hypothetical protein
MSQLANRNTIPTNVYKSLSSLRTPAKVPPELNKFVPAYGDKADYTELYRLEDKRFKTRKDLENFQKLYMYGPRSLSQDVRNLEYRWGEVYFDPLTEFMGDRTLWAALGIYVPDTNIRSAPSALSRLPITGYPVAYFSGAHWVGRRANTKEVFDPYGEFQVPGTNQFCQTYVMMHVLNIGSPLRPSSGGNWLKYYNYTRKALNFIETVIEKCKKDPKLKNLPVFKHKNTTFKNLDAAIRVCKEHPHMCLNIVKMPEN